MYALHLRSGRSITSAELQRALAAVEAECGTATHATRMTRLGDIERLEARGAAYSHQDFDVLSGALNFLDAVAPDHGLREPPCPACGVPWKQRFTPPWVPEGAKCACCCR